MPGARVVATRSFTSGRMLACAGGGGAAGAGGKRGGGETTRSAAGGGSARGATGGKARAGGAAGWAGGGSPVSRRRSARGGTRGGSASPGQPCDDSVGFAKCAEPAAGAAAVEGGVLQRSCTRSLRSRTVRPAGVASAWAEPVPEWVPVGDSSSVSKAARGSAAPSSKIESRRGCTAGVEATERSTRLARKSLIRGRGKDIAAAGMG
jgi:hypothetical protein